MRAQRASLDTTSQQCVLKWNVEKTNNKQPYQSMNVYRSVEYYMRLATLAFLDTTSQQSILNQNVERTNNNQLHESTRFILLRAGGGITIPAVSRKGGFKREPLVPFNNKQYTKSVLEPTKSPHQSQPRFSLYPFRHIIPIYLEHMRDCKPRWLLPNPFPVSPTEYSLCCE